MAKPTRQRKATAVCISDLHFNLNTLEIASAALISALSKAEELNVPLVIAGDLIDTKAIIRGECANRLLEIFDSKSENTFIYVLVGNHDLINEKGKEHSLNFLKGRCEVIQSPVWDEPTQAHLIPYFHSQDELKKYLRFLKRGEQLIMHQGVQGAKMGDYVVDKSSIDPELLAPFNVISGHYHKHQTVGTVTYIGSPYTVSFGEASDPEKGFLVLYSDGNFDRVATNLRKHLIIDTDVTTLLEDPCQLETPNPGDLIWLKVRGPYTELEKLKKRDIGMSLFGTHDFKLDKIYTDVAKLESKSDKLNETEILDLVIDNSQETPEQKLYLKKLWREVLS